MTIAARIGVADSARYLKKNRQMMGYLMNPGSFGPDGFLEALAGTIADHAAHVSGLHLFTFNQIADTVAWQQRMEERLSA
jgi:methylenetetrahydrofolate reductase (NADPH)